MKILKQNSTHKAVKRENDIAIYIKGMNFGTMVYPDELIDTIPLGNEDDLFSIFENFDETNRVLRNEL